MPSNPELLKQIETALGTFATAPLLDASLGLFGILGYESERRMKLRSSDAAGFLGTFDRGHTLNRDRALLADWQRVEFLFQLTDAEVQSAATGTDELAFDSKGRFDGAEINSFLFLAVELRPAAAREGERCGQPYTAPSSPASRPPPPSSATSPSSTKPAARANSPPMPRAKSTAASMSSSAIRRMCGRCPSST